MFTQRNFVTVFYSLQSGVMQNAIDQTKILYGSSIPQSFGHFQLEMQHHVSLNQTLDRQLEVEKTKSSRLSVDLLTTKSIADSFSKQLIETTRSVGDTEATLSQLQSEVERLNKLETSHHRAIDFLSNLVERFLEKAK